MKTRDPFTARYTIRHLGRIDHAELTIRPLTLFFGPNGTNKTWAAYALYGLLRDFRRMGFPTVNDAIRAAWRPPLARIVDAIDKQLESTPTVDAVSESARRTLSLPGLASLFPDDTTAMLAGGEIAQLLALEPEALRDAQVSLSVAHPLIEKMRGPIPDRALMTDWNGSLNVNLSYRDDTDGRQKQKTALAWPSAEGPEARRHHIETLLISSLTGIVPDVMALPAERKALIALYRQLTALNYFGLVFGNHAQSNDLAAALAGNRVAAARDLERSLPKPSFDFFVLLDRIGRRPAGTKTGPLAWLADLLGEALLRGRVDFIPNLIEGEERQLRFSSGGVTLPIHSAHSLSRSLGALDLYLRHAAQPGDVILIDEPEMNAHPTTQLAIAEFIAMMVNAGLRVIATTHSPYIVDHLHNLIEGSRLTPEQQAHFAPQFKLGTPDAFISPDMVATYHFGHDGTVTDAFDRSERVVDWSTFGDEAEYVANLYASLLEAQPDD